MPQVIDEQGFHTLCAQAWDHAATELRKVSNRHSLDTTILFFIKTRLYDFLGATDEIEGVYRIQDTPAGRTLPASEHETFPQADVRKIGDVLTGNMTPLSSPNSELLHKES